MSEQTTHDEHAGHGGSYVMDPTTGKRTLVERTQDPTNPTTTPAPVEADAKD